MNRITLRLLLLTGLAAIFCASCSKVEQLFPESFERNDKPFSVEAVPPEGCDSITLYLFRKGDTIGKKLDYTSDSLRYKTGDSIYICDSFVKIGDSLVLTAWSKNGYTFINWACDGSKITDSTGADISTQPVYGFKVKKEDIIEKGADNKKLSIISHHYEARFGLDYALQMIPPIDSIIPAELIAAMGPYLYFGDNPPKIDTCFRAKIKKVVTATGDSIPVLYPIRLARFIHNLDDLTTTYSKPDSSITNDQQVTIRFSGQHRCVAESALFIRNWGRQPIPTPSGGVEYHTLFEECKANDSIFIMGKGNEFTVYFCHDAKKRFEPYNEWADNNITDFNLIRQEWVIISGKLTTEGISECRIGTCVKGYSEPSQFIGEYNRSPAIHDIFIYDFPPPPNTLFDFPHYF